MQTAVEWLIEQINKHWDNKDVNSDELIKQAKEMEKQMVIDIVEKSRATGLTGEYLLLTYGSKGSDVTASQLKISDSCIPPESFTLSLDREEPPIIVIDKEGFKYKGELVEDKGEIYKLFKNYLTSSQTEISDEEIQQEAIKYGWGLGFANSNGVYDAWVNGCKWYREQLKKKQ